MKAMIDRFQYYFMIPNLIYGKAIGITAGVIVRKIGVDTWLSMIVGLLIGTIAMLLMTYVSSKFPDKTILQYSDELFGKWIGRVLGILLVLFFAMEFAASANVMTLHIAEYFLPQTPFAVVCAIYTLLCMYGVFLGIEVVLRFACIGFVMSSLTNVAMLTGTLAEVKLTNLLPIMEKGPLPTIENSLYLFGDIAIAVLAVGILYPMLNKKKKIIPITFWAMITSIVMIVIWPVFEIGVMGPDMMKQFVVVCMQQIRCAELTKYFPRYELLMVSFFTFGIFVQATVMFYCAKSAIKHITGIKSDWRIIIPLTVILSVITYYMAFDDNNYINFLTYPYPQICAILCIGLPIILYITMLLKGTRRRKPVAGV